jgi:threonine dehydratase
MYGIISKELTLHVTKRNPVVRGISSRRYIVMPDNAPQSKRSATAGYGAIIRDVASTQEAREEGARMYVAASLWRHVM